jgi:hypothetical protein
MPKLRERRFFNCEVVRSDEVGLDFLAFVRGTEVTPFGICEERVLPEILLVLVEAGRDVPQRLGRQSWKTNTCLKLG